MRDQTISSIIDALLQHCFTCVERTPQCKDDCDTWLEAVADIREVCAHAAHDHIAYSDRGSLG